MLDKVLSLPHLSNKIIVICGPTATGKSKLALELAVKISGIIINGDAMQVYKEIPILSAQPSSEDHQLSKHHLYSIIECGDYFSVGIWLDLAYDIISSSKTQNVTPIIVGGSGLYIKSLVDGLAKIPLVSAEIQAMVTQMASDMSPQQLHSELNKRDQKLAARLAINDIKRIARGIAVFEETKRPLSEWQQDEVESRYKRDDFIIIYIKPERIDLYEKCNDRFISMIETGAVQEVEQLCIKKPNIKYPHVLGLYEILAFLNKEISIDRAIKKAQQLTRNYAKRQLTWFNHQMQYDLIL